MVFLWCFYNVLDLHLLPLNVPCAKINIQTIHILNQKDKKGKCHMHKSIALFIGLSAAVLSVALVAKTAVSTELQSGRSKNSADAVPREVTLNNIEFQDLLSRQPLYVKSTQVISKTTDVNQKVHTPDVIVSTITNTEKVDIHNAVIAYAAWDGAGTPTQIVGSSLLDDGGNEYPREITFEDINIPAGETVELTARFELSCTTNIKHAQGFVVSFETIDGDKWENPYYKNWKEMYKDAKYDQKTTSVVELQNSSLEIKDKSNEPVINPTNLAMSVKEQDIVVIDTPLKKKADNENLLADILQPTIYNRSTHDIDNAVVAFAAWDKNNLPVKIQSYHADKPNDSHILLVEYNGVNIRSGEILGQDSSDIFKQDYGYYIDTDNKIALYKAIVVSYTTPDGEKWENPCFKDWKALYDDKKLTF